MKTCIFKASLMRSPKIAREIEVPENTSLYKLAEAIIGSYNFYLDHCFGFFSKIAEWGYCDSDEQYELFTDLIEEGEDLEPTNSGSVKKTKVRDVWRNVGDKMLFLFDYGDGWKFVVELKGLGERVTGGKYPRVIKKTGRAPKQY